MEKRFAKIVATGSYLPERVLTNEQLSQMVDTSDEWIVERTGIHRRHLVVDGEDALSMAIAASRSCLAEVDADTANKIGIVIVATCTSNYVFPGVACGVQSTWFKRACGAGLGCQCSVRRVCVRFGSG